MAQRANVMSMGAKVEHSLTMNEQVSPIFRERSDAFAAAKVLKINEKTRARKDLNGSGEPKLLV